VAEGPGAGHEPAPSDHPESEAPSLGLQSRKLLTWFTIFVVILGLYSIWKDVIPAFRFLDTIEIWSFTETVAAEAGEGAAAEGTVSTTRRVVPVYLSDLLLAILLLIFSIGLAADVPNLLDSILLVRLPFDAGSRFAISAVVRYIIIVLGTVVALGTVGIGWSKVQWLAAAITVGLGFGLQEIFANFFSGLIILFERPIRIGDIVTVKNIDGKVTRINMRSTTITDWNRRELIVPNKDFITSEIVNWTLSDSITRVDVPVGIAYGSDTDLARRLLLESAEECPHVLKTPNPYAIFLGFGDSSLDFQLRVHIPDRDVWIEVVDCLHVTIDKKFRETGVEIAFPQRDIHIRSTKDSSTLDETKEYPAEEGKGTKKPEQE
jgi:potassium efflux system protein